MIRFIRMNLELEGYQVIEAGNGIQALENVRQHVPDLVVMDVMMPEMDGFETLRLLREISTVRSSCSQSSPMRKIVFMVWNWAPMTISPSRSVHAS